MGDHSVNPACHGMSSALDLLKSAGAGRRIPYPAPGRCSWTGREPSFFEGELSSNHTNLPVASFAGRAVKRRPAHCNKRDSHE